MITSFPGVLQRDDFSCGAACCTSILRYHGYRMGLKSCSEALFTAPLDGTDLRTLEAFFRSRGLFVLSGEMDLDDLWQQTQRGRPVLCLTAGHYVVVLGVGRSRVRLHDPLCGETRPTREQFLATWSDLDRSGTRYERFGMAVWWG